MELIMTCHLRSQDKSALFKKESEITGEIEASGEPPPSGDIKLGPTSAPESLHVLHGPPKRRRIGRPPIPHPSKLRDWFHHLPRRRHLEEAGAGNRTPGTREPGPIRDGPERRRRELEGENGDPDEDKE